MRHLLLLDGVSGRSKDVTTAKKHGAGDAPLERLQEREFALLERELGIAAAKLNAIGGVNFVERGGIHAQGSQLVISLAGRLLRRRDSQSQRTTEREDRDPELHA